MEIKKIGVMGCGLMGCGIAEVSAKAGYDVLVSEINQNLLDKGMQAIDESLARAVKAGKMTDADKATVLQRIKGTIKIADFGDRDLMIEAAVENLELKKKIFTELDTIVPKDSILATNTSCLSVIAIASATKRQDKVVGMHFFNPVPVMKLLELVRTVATSEETLAEAKKVGEKLGKSIIVAPDVPGFIVNRLLMPHLIEAFKSYESGLASREDIDKGVQLGLGYPMGPLALADYVGLDTIVMIGDAMFEETKDSHMAIPVILRKMVAAGWYGRKSGKGFYDYTKK
ncbi:MAG TPA: 3-hydroxybutyryl-CoA dehydrogenase [Dehalococcoidia bacterium]|nr:3-hydroxybutyryl-CoA dehydrogenase [Dehalococcoidia bacterium]